MKTAAAEHDAGLESPALVNKTRAAEIFGVSLQTIDAWIRRGAPVARRGDRKGGIEWRLHVLELERWRIRGEVSPDTDPDDLKPMDRRAWYEAEKKKIEVAAAKRDLIPAGEVERVISTAFAALAQDIRAIPDDLERRHGLTPATAELVERGLFEALAGLSDRLSSLGPTE